MTTAVFGLLGVIVVGVDELAALVEPKHLYP
jgi:hypothetical protein